jgi:hypothetical protein
LKSRPSSSGCSRSIQSVPWATCARTP